MEWVNLVAVIIIPILAVIIAQYLQNRSEKRKDKMQIFKVLMTSRIYGWTPESVHCLNLIDVVFSDDKEVRKAWKDLYDKYCVENPTETELKKIKDAKYKLLETIAHSLGYKNKITWETIQNPYIPKGMISQQMQQNARQEGIDNLIKSINSKNNQ